MFSAKIALFLFLSCVHCCHAEEPTQNTLKVPLEEEQVSTQHQITLNGETIHYTATAGEYVLKSEKGDPKGKMFYVSYIKDGIKDNTERPLTFCFNGGPGTASIWLHMGAFGPKRVNFSEKGLPAPPYSIVTNDYSILDLTDLVFVDPISTGYSRAAPGEDPKQFHGVEEDMKWIGEFIRLFITRTGRWDSPKFLAGESYGGTRAAVLSKYLRDSMNMDLNGIILISPVLNYNVMQKCDAPTDLSFILYVPSFAAGAHYHKKANENTPLKDTLRQAEEFAYGAYSKALLQGSALKEKEQKENAAMLTRFFGLPVDYIERANLRVLYPRFCKELLKSQNRTIGRFDCRYLGMDGDSCGSYPEYDPSFEPIMGAFAATFYQYVHDDLHWIKDAQYNVLVDILPWNWKKSSNGALDVSDDLRETMTINPNLTLFVASGYYDLAVPYLSTRYTIDHLGLDPALQSHVIQATYEAGHMMYTHLPALIQLKTDLTHFYHFRPAPIPNPAP